ncbi:MAG: hypothetical protein ACRDRJ_03130 [Streptosporangiaceae bacterium]
MLPEFITNIGAAAESRPERKRGSALVNTATALLFALAVGLFAVSIAAQYAYILAEKHGAIIVSAIEATALDAGMMIFTLLALGLARAGQSARIERLLVVACAVGSAGMNLAAANTGDIRSVLAYTVPPLFLSVVVDRVVSVVRRHFLGDSDASAWANLGKITLYGLRLLVAPWSTLTGMRRELLNRTPVPEAPKTVAAKPVPPVWPPIIVGPVSPVARVQPKPVKAVEQPKPIGAPKAPKPTRPAKPRTAKAGTSKSAQLIALAMDHHNLAGLPLDEVSSLATRLSADVNIHPATGRRVLLAHARQLQNGGK